MEFTYRKYILSNSEQYIMFSQLIFLKSNKIIKWRRDSLFNQWCWNNWIFEGKKMNLYYYLTLYIKTNMKWTINVKNSTFGGINTGKHICDVGLGKDSLDKIQKAQNIKKLIYWIPSKLKFSTFIGNEKASHDLKENTCNLYIWERINLKYLEYTNT